MRKFFSLILCIIILMSSAASAAAATTGEDAIISSQETTTEYGLTIVDELFLYPQQTRSSDRSAERRKSFYDGDTLIAVIAFTATFRYDGSTVSVVSKSVTQTDTYESWSYKQNSFTSSGGTVTLSGRLTKWLIFNSSFSMGITCDVNGNISAT